MFRHTADLCARALNRPDYLFTLARRSVLDRLAGPMPERLTDQLIYEDTESCAKRWLGRSLISSLY